MEREGEAGTNTPETAADKSDWDQEQHRVFLLQHKYFTKLLRSLMTSCNCHYTLEMQFNCDRNRLASVFSILLISALGGHQSCSNN